MVARGTGPPGRSPRRLGQNFLADPNLLEVIVREAGLSRSDVVLEVGGGGGALTERLAPAVSRLHVIEVDRRLRRQLEALAQEAGDVELTWGDAMRLDLDRLTPAPNKMVSNLPYSIATPLLIRTIAQLPTLETWVVMVQREIADRLRAKPGGKTYGSASVLVQLACEVEMLRTVDPAVFVPRPRVGSALLRLTPKGPGGVRERRGSRQARLRPPAQVAPALAGAEPSREPGARTHRSGRDGEASRHSRRGAVAR